MKKILGEYQLCPKCNGAEMLPSLWPGMELSYDQCDVCKGAKIIAKPIIWYEDRDVYIEVPVEKPPSKHGLYGVVWSDGDLGSSWYLLESNEWELDKPPDYWLKKVKLSELIKSI